MTNASRPAPPQAAGSGLLRVALLVVAAILLASACSGSETAVTADPAAQDATAAPADETTAPAPADAQASSSSTGSADGAGSADSGASEAEETSAEANDQLWSGPDWLDLPAGFTVTWGYPREAGLDGLVQGDLAADLASADAVAHMRGVLLAQGYTPVNDTPEWIVVGNDAGEFIQVGASGFDDDRTMNINFLTAETATQRGLSMTLDVLTVDIGGEIFEIEGRCSENAEGFSGAAGDSFVSINGEAPDFSVFMTIIDPTGVGWSSLGGDITDINPGGFQLTTTLISDNSDLVETSMSAVCN